MKKKYILSIDGGGVRTIASIIFLQKLEANLEVSLSEKFDFFIGTSAGAISSLGLSINKMSAADLMNIWSKENLVKTMTNSSWETSLGIMQINPKYTNTGKREVLREFFSDKKLGDAHKPVAVTSYDIEKRLPVLLTSYGDPDVSVVDSGDATSAAPVYYPTAQVGDRFLIDGGFADVALNKVTLLAERSFNLKDSSKEEFEEAINDVNKQLEDTENNSEKESLLLKKQL